MVWSWITHDKKGPLVCYEAGETVDDNRYMKLVEEYIVSVTVENDYWFMQDVAHTHIPDEVCELLAQNGIELQWHTARSCDFNPIEGMW